MDIGLEQAVRDAAFDYLKSVTDSNGVAAHSALGGFHYRGERVHLISQQGIFKPRQLDLPISIRTAPPSTGREPPYEDRFNGDDHLLYRYRGTDVQHHENVRLRLLMEAGLPMVYFHGVDRGRYLVSGALLMADRPSELAFEVALTDLSAVGAGLTASTLDRSQRGHQLRLVKQRVNQASFRERVMNAYKSCCALCRLKHRELLDAAHIRSYADGGASIVPNGLSLCKIHHAAFDAGILGIRPDLVAEIRADVLLESDGPMLAHGLQALHGTRLSQPRNEVLRADVEALEYRYEQFRSAS